MKLIFPVAVALAVGAVTAAPKGNKGDKGNKVECVGMDELKENDTFNEVFKTCKKTEDVNMEECLVPAELSADQMTVVLDCWELMQEAKAEKEAEKAEMEGDDEEGNKGEEGEKGGKGDKGNKEEGEEGEEG